MIKFYDCKDAILVRKILGFSIVYKNIFGFEGNFRFAGGISSLLIFGFPLIQKKTYRHLTGGGVK